MMMNYNMIAIVLRAVWASEHMNGRYNLLPRYLGSGELMIIFRSGETQDNGNLVDAVGGNEIMKSRSNFNTLQASEYERLVDYIDIHRRDCFAALSLPNAVLVL